MSASKEGCKRQKREPDDIPDDILDLCQLPEALVQRFARDTCKALLVSGKKSRDWVLRNRDSQFQLTVPVSPERAASAKTTLITACGFESATLILKASADLGVPDEACTASAIDLLAGVLVTKSYKVQLSGFALDCLVPTWLIASYDKLRELHISDCAFMHAISLPAAPHLTKLTISGQHPDTQGAANVARWRQQLAGLTGLASLTITVPGEQAAHLLDCTAPAVPQLTSLRITGLNNTQLGLLSLLTRLSNLQLPDMVIGIGGMEVVLTLKLLKELVCYGIWVSHVCLNDDYDVGWERLGVTQIDMSQLALLPNHKIKVFAAGAFIDVIPARFPELADMMLAALEQNGGIESATGSAACISNGTIRADTARLLQAVLVLKGTNFTALTFINIHGVEPALLDTVGEVASDDFTTIMFKKCRWEWDVWPGLLASLPPSVTRVQLGDGLHVYPAASTVLGSLVKQDPATHAALAALALLAPAALAALAALTRLERDALADLADVQVGSATCTALAALAQLDPEALTALAGRRPATNAALTELARLEPAARAALAALARLDPAALPALAAAQVDPDTHAALAALAGLDPAGLAALAALARLDPAGLAALAEGQLKPATHAALCVLAPLHRDARAPLSEALLTVLCVTAVRPITLHIRSVKSRHKWKAGWQQRVQVAMGEAGHHHVTVVVE